MTLTIHDPKVGSVGKTARMQESAQFLNTTLTGSDRRFSLLLKKDDLGRVIKIKANAGIIVEFKVRKDLVELASGRYEEVLVCDNSNHNNGFKCELFFAYAPNNGGYAPRLSLE